MNYEIKNSFIKAKIKSFGAELNSLQKIENDFEYIWQADSQYWARHSPVLFPDRKRIPGGNSGSPLYRSDTLERLWPYGYSSNVS